VQRLDIDTSGIVLIAKTASAFTHLRRQFQRREITKTYWALVWGLTDAEGKIEAPLTHDASDRRRMRAIPEVEKNENKRIWPAVTEYRRIGCARELSLLEVSMKTGVTHQIRVHLAAVGHPIVADPLYGAPHADRLGLQRHFLHARRLAFRHPQDDRKVTFDAKLPKGLQDLLRRLGVRL
jgi:23S rRNA pseudouridine1911/1915/1917 synthase